MDSAARTRDLWSRTLALYQGLTLPVRLGVVLVVALLVFGFGYWNTTPRQADWVYLLGGQEFSETQMQSFCRALEAEGLTGFQTDGTRLRIPRAQVAQYAAALAKREVLPASFYTAFDKAAEQASWWSSSTQDDRRWELARQKFLAQIIEQMPEVETASVLIDRSTPKGLRAVPDIRGTVTVKPRGARELPAHRLRQIRHIVAGAVAQLSPDNVTVVDLGGKAMVELGSVGSGSEDLLERMKEFEEYYTRKIRGVLVYIPDALVAVSVELDTTRQRRTAQIVLPPGEEPSAATGPPPETSPPPSVSANTAAELAHAAPTPARPEPRPTQQQTLEEHVALAPKKVTVALAIPQDVAATLTASRSVAPAAADAWVLRIKEQVAHAIPAGVASDISVQLFPRPLERKAGAPAAAAGSIAWTWLPWVVVAGLVLTLATIVALGGRTLRAARTGPQASRTVRSESSSALGTHRDAPGDVHRELVRIERSPAARRQAPHLGRGAMNGFEDLRRLAPGSLQAVLAAVNGRLWAPALRGASRELCERVLTHMPAQAATLLRDEIAYLGPVRLGDVESAQQEILEVVRRLDHNGDLVLEDREEVYRD